MLGVGVAVFKQETRRLYAIVVALALFRRPIHANSVALYMMLGWADLPGRAGQGFFLSLLAQMRRI